MKSKTTSRALAVFIAAAVALTCAGCSGDDDVDGGEYAPVCVDPTTQQRLPDDACDDDGDGMDASTAVLLWFALSGSGSSRTYIVPVGSTVPSTGYTKTLPYKARVAPPPPRMGGYATPNPKVAVPADKWVERNPAYKGKVVQDKTPVKQQTPKPQQQKQQAPKQQQKQKPAGGGGFKPAGGGGRRR